MMQLSGNKKGNFEENKNVIVVECLKCRKIVENGEKEPLISGPEDVPKGFKRLISSVNQQKQNDDPLRSSVENGGGANKAIISPNNKAKENGGERIDEEANLRKQRQIWRACLVTFEVSPESERDKALANFKLSKTASVSSLNECAFICYQNACSNVLFELGPGGEESTEGSGVRLSKCHLDIESNTEKCSGNLQRHYSYPNINMTLMSCVRCVAKKPTTVSPFAEIFARSTASTPTQNETTREATYETPTNIPIIAANPLKENNSENKTNEEIPPSTTTITQESENKTEIIPSKSTTILLSQEVITQTPFSSPKPLISPEQHILAGSVISLQNETVKPKTENSEVKSNEEEEKEASSTPKEGNVESLVDKRVEQEEITAITINPKESEENKEFVGGGGGIFEEKPKNISEETLKTEPTYETKNISEETLKTEPTYETPSTILPSTTPIIPIIAANPLEENNSENKTNEEIPLLTTTNIPLAITTAESEIGGIVVPVIIENEKKNQTEDLNEGETNKTENKATSSTTINPQNEVSQTSSPGFGPLIIAGTTIKEGNETFASELTTISTLGNATVSANEGIINESTYPSELGSTIKENEGNKTNNEESNIEGEGSVISEEIQEKELSTSIGPETEPKVFGIAQEGQNESSEIPLENLSNSTTIPTPITTGTEELESTKESSPETEIEGPIILGGSESNLGETTTELTSETEKAIETNATNLNEATTNPSRTEGIGIVTTPETYEANATDSGATSTKEAVIGVIPIENEKEVSEIPSGVEANTTETTLATEASTAIEEGVLGAVQPSEIPITSEENSTTPENYEANTTFKGVSEIVSSTSEEGVFGVIPLGGEQETSEIPPESTLANKEIEATQASEINTTLTPETYELNATATGISEATVPTSKEEIFGVIPPHEEGESSELPTSSEVNTTSIGISSNTETGITNETLLETTPISDLEKEKLGAIAGAISVIGASEENAKAQTANKTEESTHFDENKANMTKGIEIEGVISSLNETKEETPISLSTTPSGFETTSQGEFIAAMHETEAETLEKGLETNATTSIPEVTSAKESIAIVGLGSEEVGASGEVETNATTPSTYESNATSTSAALATPETVETGPGIHGVDEESSEITATTQVVFETSTAITLESTPSKESLAVIAPGNVENETFGAPNATTPSTYELNTTASVISETISTTPENKTKEEIFGVIPFEGENEEFSNTSLNATTPETLLTTKAEGIINETAEINITATPETSTTKEEIFGVLPPHEEEKEASELPAELNPELNATTPSRFEANITATGASETSSTSKEEIFGVIPFGSVGEVSEIPSAENVTTESISTNRTITAISEGNNATTEIIETTTSTSETENLGVAAGPLGILGASEGTPTNETGEIIGAAQASEIPTNASNSQLTGFEIEGVIRKINGTQKEMPILGAGIGAASEFNETTAEVSTLESEKEVSQVFGSPLEINATTPFANLISTPETEAIGIFGVKPEEEKEVSEIPSGIEANQTLNNSTLTSETSTQIGVGEGISSETNISTTPETEPEIFGIAHDGKEENIPSGIESNANSTVATTSINEATENATLEALEGNNATSATITPTEGPINVVVLGPSELFGGATENATIHPSENEETTIEGEIGLSEGNVTSKLETSTNETELIGAATEEGIEGNISTTLENKVEGIFGVIPEGEEGNNTTGNVTEATISETNTTIEGINTTTEESPINVAVLGGPPELSEGATENNTTIQPEELLTTISEGNISSEFSTISSNSENVTTTEEMPELINAVSQVVDVKKIVVTEEPTVAAVTKLVDFVGSNGTIGEIRPHNILKDFGNRECSGELLFTGEILTDYTQSFEIIIASETVYECVKTCYLLNCTKAAFTHFPRSACLLHFNLNELQLEQKCENETEFVSNWNFKQIPEVVSIKCIKCEKGEEEKQKLNER
uniref:Apple domain-containing protein n=1 Tax=Meloidogyne javanica TaxID=6303 RepID=A0A915LK85_MELJA